MRGVRHIPEVLFRDLAEPFAILLSGELTYEAEQPLLLIRQGVSQGRATSPSLKVPGVIGFIGVSSVPSGRLPLAIVLARTHSR